MNDFFNWIVEHWEAIATAIAYLVAAASVLAKLTPTEVDDTVLGRIIKFLDFIAINNKPTELRKGLRFDGKGGCAGLPVFAALAVLALCLLSVGCASKVVLSPEDQALVTVQKLTDDRAELKAEYLRQVEMLPPEKVAELQRRVAPVLNESKRVLVLVRRKVQEWKAGGQAFADCDGVVYHLQGMYSQAWAAMGEIAGVKHDQ